MTTEQFEQRIRQLLKDAPLTSEALDVLDDLKGDVLDTLLSPLKSPSFGVVLPDTPATELLLDILSGMTALDRSDPAHPLALASALHSAGRFFDSALAFLNAAQRFNARASTDQAITDDEADWAQSSLEHAADCFRLAGMRIAPACLPSDNEANRDDIEDPFA